MNRDSLRRYRGTLGIVGLASLARRRRSAAALALALVSATGCRGGDEPDPTATTSGGSGSGATETGAPVTSTDPNSSTDPGSTTSPTSTGAAGETTHDGETSNGEASSGTGDDTGGSCAPDEIAVSVVGINDCSAPICVPNPYGCIADLTCSPACAALCMPGECLTLDDACPGSMLPGVLYCRLSECGNGEVEPGEQCDLADENLDDGDCTSVCKIGVCGDGLVHTGKETCDDGNDIPDDACPNDCGIVFDSDYSPPRIVAGYNHVCALSDAGAVRCWGGAPFKEGQLGYGSKQQVGNDPGEMPPPDVDVGGPVAQIVAGDAFTCALLVGGTVRCWGHNSSGQLGYGHTENVGDEPGEMPPPDIDVGGEVVQIAAGEARTCALLKTGAVRCWGISWVDPDLDPIGDDPGDMPPPDVLVTGTFTQIHAAKHEACVVRDDGTVACWTGDMIPHERPFGGVVVELSGYICARMNDGAARCLGYNDYGQKGYGHTKYVGDPVQAGDIPVGGLVTRIAPGEAHTCAIAPGGAVRCWGANFCGGLGYGHTMDLGDMPGELPTPDVLLGGPAIDVALAFGYGCALLAGDEVRCWGCGNEGNLGYGNYQDIGDAPGEMPPPVVPVF